MVSSNIVLDRGPSLARIGEIWLSEFPVCSDAAYDQITLALIVVKNYNYIETFLNINDACG